MAALVYTYLYDWTRAFEAADRAIRMAGDRSWEAAHSYVSRSVIHRMRGEYNEALDDLNQALDILPDTRDFLLDRSSVCDLIGEHDKALADGKRVLALNPDDVNGYALLLYQYHRNNEMSELRSLQQELREKADSWSDDEARVLAYKLLASHHSRSGESEEALALLDMALRIDPDDQSARLSRIRARLTLEGPGAIAGECEQLAALTPESLNEDIVRAQNLLDLCRLHDQALSAFNDIVRRAPNWPDPHWRRGNLHFNIGNYDLAMRDYDRTSELAPAWANPYRMRGMVHMFQGDYRKALAEVERSIELEPDNNNTIYNRALIYMNLEQYESALADLDRSLEDIPTAYGALWHKAIVLARLGREEEAISTVDWMIESNPSEFSFLFQRRADLLACIGRLDEAIATLDQAIDHSPGSALNLIRRAFYEVYRSGNCDLARADLDRALALAPESAYELSEITKVHALAFYRFCPSEFDPDFALNCSSKAIEEIATISWILMHHGFALYRKGDFMAARDSFLQALEIHVPTRDLENYFGLAMANGQLGERDEALRYYTKAVDKMEKYLPRYAPLIALREEAARLLDVEP
jgi:tetratricopeptide (TPR) repeat protein